MHLIFVLLFVGGCTIKGTLSDEPDYHYPQPPAPLFCKNGAKCMNDNQCGGPRGGGFCEHYHPLKLMRYLTILLHL